MNTKRKSILCSVFILLLIVFLTIPIEAEDFLKKFDLKLSGGYGNTTGGFMTDWAAGINSQFADRANIFGFSITNELENVEWGPELEGEIVFRISRNFEVGLSVGYMKKKGESV